MSRPAAALVVAGLVLLGGCSGDDVFPRDEFIKQTVANGIKKPVAECAYDHIKGNKAIMAELNRTGGPNTEISEKVSGELSTILARCLLAAENDGATTSPTTTAKRSTTTKK